MTVRELFMSGKYKFFICYINKEFVICEKINTIIYGVRIYVSRFVIKNSHSIPTDKIIKYYFNGTELISPVEVFFDYGKAQCVVNPYSKRIIWYRGKWLS